MRLEAVEARVVHVGMRLPFRYGIATMTSAPHAVVRVRVTDGAATFEGTSGENLPPKWFTKYPDTSAEDDLREMAGSVLSAVRTADGLEGESAFDLAQRLMAVRRAEALADGVPGLLAGLGVSLVERAVIDAVCRAAAVPFHRALRDGVLGFDAAAIHPELSGMTPSDLLPSEPDASIAVRHTVGLGDRVLGASDRPQGLPVTLEEVMAEQGVHFLKLKTQGDLASDLPRLREILDLADAFGGARFTVDGNESMTSPEHLREWLLGLLRDKEIGDRLGAGLVAIEQPVHRSVALDEGMKPVLRELSREVPIIIDESDDWPETVRRAMDLGYAGGTYKGCKGVFRGVANAMLVEARRREDRPTLLTAEDLTTLPPLPLNQDLAVACSLGLGHIERNGHHYFSRVVPVDPEVDAKLVDAHPDAFHLDGEGRAQLTIDGGLIHTGSLNAAAFGLAPDLDVSGLELLV